MRLVVVFCWGLLSWVESSNAFSEGSTLAFSRLSRESYAAESGANLPLALQKMTLVYQSQPESYFVNLRLGWLFLRLTQYKNSLNHYRRAADLEPSSVEALEGMIQVYTAIGDQDRVRETAREILRRDPRSRSGRQSLVRSLLVQGQLEEAVQETATALKFYPSDALFLEQSAWALIQLQRFDEARTLLDRLLVVSPENLFANEGLAKWPRADVVESCKGNRK